ncbi:MAG: DUF4956 domain-containing protein [Phycisphaerales bacterium]|nr:DUF4956 domain-containing protein [Phycisphaerales bacterium]
MDEFNGIMNTMTDETGVVEQITFAGTTYTLVLATVFGLVVAMLHLLAHRDKPTTRLWRTLVLISPLIAMATMAVGTNLAAAFTLFGTLAIVRFRTPIKEPMDAAFVIFSVVIGLATGNQNFLVASVGTMVIGATVLILLFQTQITNNARPGRGPSRFSQNGRGRLKISLNSTHAPMSAWQVPLDELGIRHKIRSCTIDETLSTTSLVVELTRVSSDEWPTILGKLLESEHVTTANGGPLDD